jgi:putative hydrolase of the HAD superfamily
MSEGPGGVLFDLDGTLLDHEAAVRSALAAWLSGYMLTRGEVEDLIPLWLEVEERHYATWRSGEISFQEQRRRRLRDFLPVVGVSPREDRLDSIFGDYLTAYEHNWTAYDDARPALTMVASAGLRVGVLTNGQREQQTAKLVATGLSHLCGDIFASSALAAAKPDPRAYLAACRGLGLPPAEVLMVGDHYEVDVVGARAAGLQAVHLDRSGQDRRPEPHRITTLRELRV